MAATSEVQICSNALLLLGASTISSFSEDNDRARLCSNLWPMVRDATLRSHPWNCAMKRVALAPDAVGPDFDWAYQFTLPGDWLRVWSVGRDEDSPIEFMVENGKVLMDEAICYLRYIQALADVSRYDSMLVSALTMAMEAALAYPITKSKSQQDSSTQRYINALKMARTVDGQEGTGERSPDSVLITVRGA